MTEETPKADERPQLPPDWDDARDLLVVTGAEARLAAQRLASRGLARILAISDGGPVAGAWVEHTEDKIRAVCEGFASLPPLRVVYAERGAPVPSLPSTDTVKVWVDGVLTRLHSSRNTRGAFGVLWALQTIANAPGLVRGLPPSVLRDPLAGRPLVVVCPGPSLEKNIAQLRGLEGRVAVVAVSHALHALERAGVVADVVVTVDPEDCRPHFSGVDPSSYRTIALDVGVHPELLDVGRAPPLVFACNGMYAGWLRDSIEHPVEGVATGGSVTHAAAWLGMAWGCSPIVFIGMDLSFPGGRIYASSTIDPEARVEVDEQGGAQAKGYGGSAVLFAAGQHGVKLLDAPGWDGSPVQTSVQFDLFRRWFEGLARDHPKQRFVNATEGGVHVDGFEHRTLADVLAELPEGPKFDVDAALRAATESSRPEAALQRLRANLDAQRRGCAEAQLLADRCVKHIERNKLGLEKAIAARSQGRRASPSDEAALDDLETRLEKKLADTVRPLGDLTLALQQPILTIQDQVRGESASEKVQCKRLLFRTVSGTAGQLKTACEATLQRLRET